MGCLCPKNQNTEQTENPDHLDLNDSLISPSSFRTLKVVGRGTFGKVVLVEKKGTKDCYAMKILKKKEIQEKNQRQQSLTERTILAKASCPFIVKLFWAFQDKKNLYMVLEYLSGGELFFHLSQQGLFSELRTRFYAVEIVLGLEYLHDNNIIYRDLKPENIVLDSLGHVRLTDFGLSKEYLPGAEKTLTICGTAEYLAPEIIKGAEYNKAVDFWSLGAVMYYMLSGAPPHYSKNKAQIFKNVLTKPIEPILSVTNAANELMQSLLKVDPNERLGSMAELKAHDWFSGVNWEEAYQKRMEPPFKPRVKASSDTSNFDRIFTSEKTEETIETLEISTPGAHYSGFTYKDQSMNSRNSKQMFPK